MVWFGVVRKKEKKVFMMFRAVWTVPHEREEREKRTHKDQHDSKKNTQLFLLTNSIYSLRKLRTNIQRFILVLVVLGLLVWLVN